MSGAEPILVAAAGASLFAGIKTGVTQGVLSGDTKAVSAGLGNIAKGNLNKVGKTVVGAITEPFSTKTATKMPSRTDQDIEKTKLNTLRNLQARSGRASTLLTSQVGSSNTFGG